MLVVIVGKACLVNRQAQKPARKGQSERMSSEDGRQLPLRNPREVVAHPFNKLDPKRQWTRQQDTGLRRHFVMALSTFGVDWEKAVGGLRAEHYSKKGSLRSQRGGGGRRNQLWAVTGVRSSGPFPLGLSPIEQGISWGSLKIAVGDCY